MNRDTTSAKSQKMSGKYVAFQQFSSATYPSDKVSEGIGWYYTKYNPETGEGKGIFGTPEDPEYKFEFAVINGKLKGRNCGFGQGCFWSGWH